MYYKQFIDIQRPTDAARKKIIIITIIYPEQFLILFIINLN